MGRSVSSPQVITLTSTEIGVTEIGILDANLTAQWDAYVGQHPQGSLYHLVAWRDLIRSVFGHDSIYLYARRAGAIVGVLPLIRLKSRLFGDYMVSVPYFNYGGAISESASVSELLMKAASDRARDIGCSHIEFRDIVARETWPVRTDKVDMELALPADVATLWSMFSPKLRSQIRKPQKEGAEFVHGNIELLPDFYAVFSRNMRDLGTPVYGESFFKAVLEQFPQHASIALVRYQGRTVAAGFLLGHRGRLEIPWASSLREYNSLGVNMLLYMEILKLAIEGGYRTFDFGRSSMDSGTYRFKKQWGASEKQLYWHYWLVQGKHLPQLNPTNPKYRFAVSLWSRLPLWVANSIGPHIVKNLP